MAFTNVTTVRKHLTEFRRTLKNVNDLMFRLSGDDPQDLPHKGIKSSSEKVKGKKLSRPFCEMVVLGDGITALSHSELVVDSVAVARDQSLTEVYSENIDYMVNYGEGTISRIESGAIEAGRKVAVWYYYFQVYARDVDYGIDYGAGKIKRLPDGNIEEGQLVWIDYEVETGMFADDMMARAIAEAHTDLESRIDEIHADSQDTLLEVAETYLAVQILARMKGLEVLQSEFINPSQKTEISEDYLNLGDSYGKQAERILEPYLKKKDTLAFPKVIRNASGSK